MTLCAGLVLTVTANEQDQGQCDVCSAGQPELSQITFYGCSATPPSPPPSPAPPTPPETLETLAAQISALQAKMPPSSCDAPGSLLQRNASGGWICVPPVAPGAADGAFCRTPTIASEAPIVCDQPAPVALPQPMDCMPPGGMLIFNASLGVWMCSCFPAFVGESCNITAPPPPPPASGSVVTIVNASTLTYSSPQAIAVDLLGNVYFLQGNGSAHWNAGLITRMDASTGAITTLASGLTNTGSIAVSNSGNVYAANYDGFYWINTSNNNGGLIQWATLYSNQFLFTHGIAVDGIDNVYTYGIGNYIQTFEVVRYSLADGSVTVLSKPVARTLIDSPYGVTVDASGNVYFVSKDAGTVSKIDKTGNITTLAGGFNLPGNLAVDLVGNVYVADTGNSAIKKISSSGVVTTIGNGFSEPQGVAVDQYGNVYVADTGNNQLKKIFA